MASPYPTMQPVTPPANYRVPFSTPTSGATSTGGGSAPTGPSGFTAYDQYEMLQQRFPGFQLQQGPGSIQSSVQGTPITQWGRPIGQDPTFNDVLSPIYRGPTVNAPANLPGVETLPGNDLFQQGLGLTQQDYSMSPETLQIQQAILTQGARARAQAVADQQALSAQYGRGGSSTEAFGVAQAGTLADEATQKNLTALSLQNLQRQQAAKDLATKGLFERAGYQTQLGSQQNVSQQGNQYGLTEAQLQADNQRLMMAANLTSDEVASLRNLSEADKNRVLQERLGVLGINTASWTSQAEQNTAKDIARGNQKSQIVSSIIGGGATLGAGASIF